MSGPWEQYGSGPWKEYAPKKDLGEFDLPFEFSGRQAKTALGMLTTFSPERQLQVLKENYPNLKFYEDEKGQIIVDGSAYGGEPGYLNAPGISKRDVLQAGFNIAAFAPVGRAISATTTAARAAQAAAASGGIQGAIEGANAASGGFDSLGDSVANIGTAALIGGTTEALFTVIAPRIAPAVAKMKLNYNRVTPDVRESVRLALKDAGVPDAQITEQLIYKALSSVAKNTGKRVRDVSSGMVDDAVKATGVTSPVIPAEVRSARVEQLANEFGIPYTRGQRTGDMNLLMQEDAMLHGGMGPRAQAHMQNFVQGQDKAIGAARGGVQGSLSGGAPQISRTAQAGDVVTNAVKAAEHAADVAVDEAYGAVGDAFLSPNGLAGLMQRIKQSVRGVEFDPSLPQTAKVLNGADDVQRVIKSFGGKIRPYHIKQVEAMRRRLGTAIEAATDNADRRQLLIMKRAFDQYLDDAIDGALFSGDDAALEALKEARSIYADYAKKFMPNPTRGRSGKMFQDEAGNLVERIIYANPSPEEVMNYIFGSVKLSKNASPRIVARLKTILGEDSAEWNALREAAFLRLTGGSEGMTPATAQVYSTRLQEAISGDGRALMEELFTKSEVKLFRRLADAMKASDPFSGRDLRTAFNKSKTSYSSARITMRLLSRLIGGEAAELGIGVTEGITGARAAAAATAPPKVKTPMFTNYLKFGIPVTAAEQGVQD